MNESLLHAADMINDDDRDSELSQPTYKPFFTLTFNKLHKRRNH